MASYKTPGVYVQEVSTLPASIAAVETAIPAFIGYTQQNSYKGESLDDKPYKVSSLLEYEEVFGGTPSTRTYVVELDSSSNPQAVSVEDNAGAPYYMHDAIRMFYANGGGDCYIVSVGTFGTAPTAAALKDGIDALKREDEPTLLVFPDVVTLASNADIGSVNAYALAHCAKLQDRFSVLDVKESSGNDAEDNVGTFRDEVGINNLKYGAAYTPYVHAGLGEEPTYGSIQLEDGSSNVINLAVISSDPAPVLDYDAAIADETRLATVLGVDGQPESSWEEYYGNITAGTAGTEAEVNHYIDVTGELAKEIADLVYSGTSSDLLTNSKAITYATSVLAVNGDLDPLMVTLAQIVADWNTNVVGTVPLAAALTWTSIAPATDFDGTPYPDYELDTVAAPAANTYFDSTATTVSAAISSGRNALRSTFESILAVLNGISATLGDITNTQEGVLRSTNSIYSSVIKRIKAEGFAMPSSAAVVGKYAEVDSTRGVWKAPANVSLNSVIKLTQSIDNDEQESINVDVTAGKSVNAIRKFKGKGILIWGARTLAGNDNEWRYVPVRRLFIMVEESVKKATEFVVFEPNDANTWGKVKGMISNFLTGLWRDGALAGAKPDAAFFVKCGLGETMTSQDILEGRMIVEIGMAAVRPAEFIILKFSHKLQES